MSAQQTQPCPACGGRGSGGICSWCGGRGVVIDITQNPPQRPCPRCSGTGREPGVCQYCGGTGVIGR